MKTKNWFIMVAYAACVFVAGLAWAGSLSPTNAPGPTMHTLEEICQRLNTTLGPIEQRAVAPDTTTFPAGYYTATNLADVDPDLVASNVRAGVSVFGVVGDSNVVHTGSGDATAAELKAGKKAWVQGAEVTGAMPTQVLSATTDVVQAGYYNATTLSAVDSNLATGNIRAGATLFGVAGKPEVVDTASGDAAAGDLLVGKKAWVAGVEVTGAMPVHALAPTTTAVAAGYYAATNLALVDTNLVAGNIRSNVTIFGVAGTLSTNAGNAYPGPVPKTGQTNSWQVGDDGYYRMGVAWPNPRFVAGTGISSNCVADNLTGLMWLRNPDATGRDWSNAIAYCEAMDGALGRGGYTDWRLPNRRELESLLDLGQHMPTLPVGHPFIGVQIGMYWSGTVNVDFSFDAWVVRTNDGLVTGWNRTSTNVFVWPVRGGQ